MSMVSIPQEIQGNGHKRKRALACESEEPLVRHLKKRQRTNFASAGEDAANGIKECRSTNLPETVQAGNPETLHGPPVSSQQRSPKNKRLHPGPERPFDNLDPPSKRLRTNKDKLIEHWTLNEYKWPQTPLEPDIMEHYLA
ncbi:hypothetical protein EMCG_05588 [[Emmonsia] crescens]|uniref:Uncharacterized protein n=1 Tax=[Emmonsia] crescens TaxID=73230 RepID=A0A0G2HN99_9EURO|nr:hypothetical protein EMCG_05588 [Emmonsia crescens UAMH 3008]